MSKAAEGPRVCSCRDAKLDAGWEGGRSLPCTGHATQTAVPRKPARAAYSLRARFSRPGSAVRQDRARQGLGEGELAGVGLGAGQIGPGKIGVAQIGKVEPRIAEIGIAQERLAQVGVPEIGPGQVDRVQIRLAEDGPLQVGALQVGASQTGGPEICPRQDGPLEIGSQQAMPGGPYRARLYAQSLETVYQKAYNKAKSEDVGLPELPAYPRDGSTQCRMNCNCRWRGPIKKSDTEYWVYWELRPGESCPDCIRRAKEWAPLKFVYDPSIGTWVTEQS